MKYDELTYEEQCTKYFQPIDEISEALRNNEGISGISNHELKNIISMNPEMKKDIEIYG